MVMTLQAELFEDFERKKELLSLGFDPAPHKAFDHKAPKTGERRYFEGKRREKEGKGRKWKLTQAQS
jgi:hypothetical protein